MPSKGTLAPSQSPVIEKAADGSELKGAELPASFFFRSNPLTLLRKDIWLVLSMATQLPNILRPLYTGKDQLPSAELDVRDPGNWLAVAHQIGLFLASLVAVNGAIALFALGFPAIVLAGWIAGWTIAFLTDNYLTQGDGSIVVDPKGDWDAKNEHANETWLYINGICTDKQWITSNVKMLRDLFGRNVLGIHNRTNGFLFDLVECLLQREWVYGTQDATPLLYSRARKALLDPSQKKVVIIAHSQGGIILSLVLDWLISDLPHEALKKLELYTFACAANHFNSPRGTDGVPVIPIIEHFANGRDPVARIGVLAWRDAPNQSDCIAGFQHDRFHGRLFLRPDASGHLLNQHYLQSDSPAALWPVDEKDGKRAHLWTYLV